MYVELQQTQLPTHSIIPHMFHRSWWSENLPPRAVASLNLTLERPQRKEALQHFHLFRHKSGEKKPKPPTVQINQTVVKSSPNVFIWRWNHLYFYLSCMYKTNNTMYVYCPFSKLINSQNTLQCSALWKWYYKLSQQRHVSAIFMRNKTKQQCTMWVWLFS